MSFLRTALLGAALLTPQLQAPVSAQDCAVGIKAPAAGSWAEYTTKDGNLRLAMLGTESRGGKNLVRVEMSITSREGPMIMQLLVPGYPYDMSSIEDFVMKPGNRPAMRMNAQMLQMMASRMPRDQVAEFCRNARLNRVGEESVTTPAGTFETVHYRDAESGNDVWVSESIPFGLVRSKLKSGEEILLTGRGSDAKSQITETPQEMGMPGRP
jgi:hypothetical protein